MFNRIKLKNYKSLVDIEFDISKNKKAKNIALIYGENGSGKSNIASAFFTLVDTIRTLSIKDDIQSLIEDVRLNELSEKQKLELIDMMKSNFKDTETIIKDCKTIGSQENMVLEYEFSLNDKRGKYTIEMNDKEIVYEELKYKLQKNIGIHFKMDKKNEVYLNENIFIGKKYNEEMREKIDKLWGKHTILAIISNDYDNYNKKYISENISKNLIDVLKFIRELTCKVNVGNKGGRGIIGISNKIFADLLEGRIDKKELKELNNMEEFLNQIYTNLYSDIKNVYYERIEDGNELEYKLFSKKMIGGEIRSVDFKLESTGTLNILNLIPLLYEAVKGRVVILDEFDSGIHDVMVKNLLMSVNEYIEGQLIITTHNTLLMESEIDSDSIYFIVIDEYGNKEIVCLTDFKMRTHPNHNRRALYLKGIYNAIPVVRELDFDELIEILNDNN